MSDPKDKKSNSDELKLALFKRLDQIERINVQPQRKIAIFATPRSGSSYFCNSLSKTLSIGEPWEFFNMRFLEAYAAYFKKPDFKFTDYVDFIYTKTTSESGTFSVKILIEQYLYFLKEKKFDLLSLNFDNIILVSRDDKIAQSYSFAKALRSDQWSSLVKTSVNFYPDDIKNSFILECLQKITFWEDYFDSHLSHKINLKYKYEDFSKQKNFPFEVLKDLKIDISSINKSKSDLQPQTNQNDLSRIKEFRKWLKSL